jgi:ACT domain-containing protein
MSLQDILKMLNKNLSNVNFSLSEHTLKIAENDTAIHTKADATVSLQVDSLDHKVAAIEHHLKQVRLLSSALIEYKSQHCDIYHLLFTSACIGG